MARLKMVVIAMVSKLRISITAPMPNLGGLAVHRCPVARGDGYNPQIINVLSNYDS
jgi:hypothetical protein